MANTNYNPNARFDTGPAAAGTGRISSVYATGSVATSGSVYGEAYDSTYVATDIRVGFNAAGVAKDNPGPNGAGAPRSFNAL